MTSAARTQRIRATTDPEALLAKKGKGKEARLSFMGTRRHIRAALAAAATRDEIVFVLKCASVMSLHSCSLGAPILLEEASAAGVWSRTWVQIPQRHRPATG